VVKPEHYEEWYRSARGRWIGTVEYGILKSLLNADPNASLLDIGCGTGYFTRLFAQDMRGEVVGLDPNLEWLNYANTRSTKGERYVAGVAEVLPFPERSFDYTVSVTALCFVKNQEDALRELVRVTRKRFALGLLNRHSLLFRQKGRGEGTGAYQGAHWHTASEMRRLLASLPVINIRMCTAILLPQGGWIARVVEQFWPQNILLGGFLVVTGDIVESRRKVL